MEFLKRTYFFIRFFFMAIGLWVLASGGLDKWSMMKWAAEKEHEKSISFSLKPIAIPIPIPIGIVEKGGSKAKAAKEKPWKSESKDMFWKMMMMKMVMDKGSKGKGDKGKGGCCPQVMMMGGWPAMMKAKGDKKGSKGSMMCCPEMQMMNGGWPMMKSSMKKGAGSMMCCPQMMMNGGWSDSGSSGCPMMMMMKGGWPPPPMCMCPMDGGGWPDEEEEEEPDYYEEEEQMTGWDTMNIPVLSPQVFFEKIKTKGDSVPRFTNNMFHKDKLSNRRQTLKYVFRKGARGLNYDFENDFD